jgi:thiol-disulfide isomerase/thioredoxin
MAPNDRNPNAPRPVLGILALVGAALVAVLAWQLSKTARERKAVVVAAPAGPAASPGQPPPPAPPVPYGQIVTAARPVPAPPVDLAAVGGARWSLAGARGQVVMLNFWATWCPPCAEEMPSMLALGEALAREHPGRFQMVAVSVDESPDLVKAFFAKAPWHGLPRSVPVVIEPGGGEVTRRFYCEGRGACSPNDVKFPESYFVDKQGRVVAFVVGPMDWSQPAARMFIEGLIRG